MFYDLHVHTDKSDGKLSRIELLKLARDIGLEYLSFTDHDYIDDIDYKKEFESIYGNINTKLINGVELTINDYKNMHLLSYDNKNIKKISEVLNKIELDNIEICKRLINNLERFNNIKVSLNYFDNKKLTKGSIRDYLVEYGYSKNLLEAGNYTGKRSNYYEKTISLNLKDAITLIKESDGLSSLAHPSSLNLSNDELEKLIKELKDLGLDGIEVFNSSKTTIKEKEYYIYLANKYNLLKTCGSDFHSFKNTIGINDDESNNFIKRLEVRKNV